MLEGGAHTATSWRDELTQRLLRAFAWVTLIASVPFALVVHGLKGLIGVGVLLGVGAWLYRASRRSASPGKHAMTLVVCTLACALVGYANVGFISGPAVALSMAVTLAGLLLGTRWMMSVLVLGGVSMLGIGALMSVGMLPIPRAADIAQDRFGSWLRTTTISVLLLGLFVRVIVQVVEQLENALQTARDETRAREAAEQARRETETKALEAHQLETLGRLAAGIAHDFNNNLTAIIGLSELVRSELSQTDPLRELVDEILDASTRSAELTRQLLAVSRKAQPHAIPVELQGVVEGAIKLFRRSAPKSIQFRTQLDAGGVKVRLDQALMQNALLNLMLNAKDAMAGGGTLTVSTKLAKAEAGGQAQTRGESVTQDGEVSEAWIEVADTGTGIAADVLPHVFEPFFTTKNMGEGTGLGLASVAATVRGHGGEIDVDTQLGKGTVFRVRLPCAGHEQTQQTPLEPVARSAHILVIDEDASVRAAAKANLAALGYKVTVAPGNGAALELLRAVPKGFDLAILDVRGPTPSAGEGFDALREQVPALPVLLWSGYQGNDDVAELIRRGAVGFLGKPYLPTELGAAVARALSQGRDGASRAASPQ
jgi:signal transduction histidine kinase/ActR/RegA family two-component response regulator